MADQAIEKGPDEKSSDYVAMRDYWEMIEAINGGAEAMRAKEHKYLPKFPNESAEDYSHRRKTAPFTNIYGDVSKNLASKPFSKETALKDGAASSLVELCEDIDGQGNNLHVYASTTFQNGIDYAIEWILVDYTKAPPPPPGAKPRSVAEEKDAGLRPYWIHIAADRVFAVYSDFVNGKEIITHARVFEPQVERAGWSEEMTERVRVFDRAEMADESYGPATFEVWEKTTDVTTGKVTWISIEGPSPISIGVIPLIPFLTGKRVGASWVVRPPLRDIAYLQVEEFQQESNLKAIMEATAYPMLAGNGIGSTDDKGAPIRVPAGPRAVLFAPMSGNGNHGEWKFIEPSATSIEKLMTHLDATQKNMRDLGMQPLTQANLTVITTANVSLKAHSSVQAWALALKDALEQAFALTIMWLKDGSKNPEVEVYTDFGVDFEAAKELDSLIKGQAQGIFSKKTVQTEFKRRGVLSDNFDPDEEKQQIADEEQGLQGEQAFNPVTGEVVQAPTRPKVITAQPVVKVPGPPPTVQ